MRGEWLKCEPPEPRKVRATCRAPCRRRSRKNETRVAINSGGFPHIHSFTKRKMASLSLLSLLALMQLMTSSATGQALDYICPAPASLGGLGYCGPTQCSLAATSKPKCIYTGATINYAQRISAQTCRQCTQRATSMCTTSALTSIIVGTGVKAAFCTGELPPSTSRDYPPAPPIYL